MKKKILFAVQATIMATILFVMVALESGTSLAAPVVPKWYVRLEFDPPVVVILHCTRGGMDECAL